MALTSVTIAVPSSSSAAVLPRIFSLRSTTLPLRTLSFAGTHRPFLALRNSKSIARVPSIRCSSSALTPQLKDTLDKVVTSNKGLKEYSSWPTFPQLYIEGEFFGGCDITIEAYQNGQLQELLEKAMCA
ncbi:hypothetical protein SLE2022_132920 [Rubroshorea leprosula]